MLVWFAAASGVVQLEDGAAHADFSHTVQAWEERECTIGMMTLRSS